MKPKIKAYMAETTMHMCTCRICEKFTKTVDQIVLAA